MNSVADQLRADTVRRVLALAVHERIALALTLGDDDAMAYSRAAGCDAAEARRVLALTRQRGRIPSCCAGHR